jgi:carbonic anhydrase
LTEVPPAKWQADFPMCNGTRQSPIAINTSQIEYDSSLQAIQFVQYDQHPVNNAWTVLDNGHVGKLSINSN